jgi:hypothetical protein
MNSLSKCPRCQTPVSGGQYCSNCGAGLTAPPPGVQAAPVHPATYPPPPAYAIAPGNRTSGKATAALVLGIIGLIIFPIICSVLAIVFGSIAKGEIQRDPSLGGSGSATAGLVMGIIGIAIWVLILLVALG